MLKYIWFKASGGGIRRNNKTTDRCERCAYHDYKIQEKWQALSGPGKLLSPASNNMVSSASINSAHISQTPGLAGLAKRLQFLKSDLAPKWAPKAPGDHGESITPIFIEIRALGAQFLPKTGPADPPGSFAALTPGSPLFPGIGGSGGLPAAGGTPGDPWGPGKKLIKQR